MEKEKLPQRAPGQEIEKFSGMAWGVFLSPGIFMEGLCFHYIPFCQIWNVPAPFKFIHFGAAASAPANMPCKRGDALAFSAFHKAAQAYSCAAGKGQGASIYKPAYAQKGGRYEACFVPAALPVLGKACYEGKRQRGWGKNVLLDGTSSWRWIWACRYNGPAQRASQK